MLDTLSARLSELQVAFHHRLLECGYAHGLGCTNSTVCSVIPTLHLLRPHAPPCTNDGRQVRGALAAGRGGRLHLQGYDSCTARPRCSPTPDGIGAILLCELYLYAPMCTHVHQGHDSARVSISRRTRHSRGHDDCGTTSTSLLWIDAIEHGILASELEKRNGRPGSHPMNQHECPTGAHL